MITILPILAATILSPIASAVHDYQVNDVTRNVAFAGKLGNRVVDTLTLSHDGAPYTVRLGRAHTRFGSITEFHVGETVVIACTLHRGVNLVMRDEVTVK